MVFNYILKVTCPPLCISKMTIILVIILKVTTIAPCVLCIKVTFPPLCINKMPIILVIICKVITIAPCVPCILFIITLCNKKNYELDLNALF